MPNILASLGKDSLFIALSALALLAVESVLRALLYWHNHNLAIEIPSGEIVESFLIGVRFDLIIASYIIIPPCLGLLLPQGLGRRRLARLWLGMTSAIIIFLGVLELDFYREFHSRLNSLVFQYIREDPETVARMLWHGFPVLTYLLLVAILWSLLQWLFAGADKLTRPAPGQPPSGGWMLYPARVGTALVLLVLFIGGARGSLASGPPLRWGDAVHSDNPFSNHLGLNGTFTLIKAASAEEQTSLSQWWLDAIGPQKALKVTRQMLVTGNDRLVDPAAEPLLRTHRASHDYAQGRLHNVVLIIMESFAGAYVGALGDDHGITPEFDRLAARGLLFRHFFSNGTHTHQGMFASVACFPNLPGHEYLMQQPEGSHRFSSLPALLPEMGDNNVYVYNGDFRWDNQEGFFRGQGMDHFVGRDQIDNPKFVDDVWGVSDEDLFNQAARELDKLADNGPFYAVVQTLSNHTPFSLPDPLPVKRVTGAGGLSEHLTAMRYSDWALGQFFRHIENKPYYRHTLFVIVGDHGFGNSRILSAMDLNRFRIPMLMIAPGIQGVFGEASDTVASQVDIVPTALAMLKKQSTHQCWGRDLLSLTDDPGFAVIKPSGSEQTSAIVKGHDILTLAPGNPPQLGHVGFEPRLDWKPRRDPDRARLLERELKSYIATGLNALEHNRTGVRPAQGTP